MERGDPPGDRLEPKRADDSSARTASCSSGPTCRVSGGRRRLSRLRLRCGSATMSSVTDDPIRSEVERAPCSIVDRTVVAPIPRR